MLSQGGKAPFLLQPVGKDYLWGGDKLKREYGKDLDMDPLAESWECSTHPDGTNRVATGRHRGQLLSDVLRDHPEYLGTHPRMDEKGGLPILVKFIDAKKDLSVQVHPDDAYAAKYENGSRGKSEMWYVMDADEGSAIIYGFYEDTSKEKVRDAIRKGTILNLVQRIPIHRNDVFFIEAGTVHAIPAGALIAEIQESSNLTYRLYDYGRVDKNGKERPLHIDRAMDVADLKSAASPRQPMRLLRYERGCATELLCRCRYFQTERMLVNVGEGSTGSAAPVPFSSDRNSFRILLCIAGAGTLRSGEEKLEFSAGGCIFVPAISHSSESACDIALRETSTNGARCVSEIDCPPYWFDATCAMICVAMLHAVENDFGFSIIVPEITVPFCSMSSRFTRSQLCMCCA